MKHIKYRSCYHCKASITLKTDPFVVNADGLYFCQQHFVGQPPIKDCLTEYVKMKKEKIVSEKKEIKKEEVNLTPEERKNNLNKLNSYLEELKKRKRENRLSQLKIK